MSKRIVSLLCVAALAPFLAIYAAARYCRSFVKSVRIVGWRESWKLLRRGLYLQWRIGTDGAVKLERLILGIALEYNLSIDGVHALIDMSFDLVKNDAKATVPKIAAALHRFARDIHARQQSEVVHG